MFEIFNLRVQFNNYYSSFQSMNTLLLNKYKFIKYLNLNKVYYTIFFLKQKKQKKKKYNCILLKMFAKDLFLFFFLLIIIIYSNIYRLRDKIYIYIINISDRGQYLILI